MNGRQVAHGGVFYDGRKSQPHLFPIYFVYIRVHSWFFSGRVESVRLPYLVHPGDLSFPLRDGMEALGYAQLPEFRLPG